MPLFNRPIKQCSVGHSWLESRLPSPRRPRRSQHHAEEPTTNPRSTEGAWGAHMLPSSSEAEEG